MEYKRSICMPNRPAKSSQNAQPEWMKNKDTTVAALTPIYTNNVKDSNLKSTPALQYGVKFSPIICRQTTKQQKAPSQHSHLSDTIEAFFISHIFSSHTAYKYNCFHAKLQLLYIFIK